jgi:multidrug efflux pump subunit AcrB
MVMNRDKPEGIIAIFVDNPAAAHLLMLFFLIGGVLAAGSIKQEVFPEFDLDIITISVAYPGASPAEVERGIIVAIEERLSSFEFIERYESSAQEGLGTTTIELLTGTNGDKALQTIKNEIDRITSLPLDAEEPIVQLSTRRREVLRMALYGALTDTELYQSAHLIKDELLSRPGISQVDMLGIRVPEISVSVSQHILNEYGLTLGDIAERISQKAVDVPAGAIKTDGGEILIRTMERLDFAREFAQLELLGTAGSKPVYLGDIAKVEESFEDVVRHSYYNGEPSVGIFVYRVGEQTPISVSRAVHEFADEFRPRLPEGVALTIYNDRSSYYQARMELLLRNGVLGLMLVLLCLTLLMEPRLAFWVAMGIPISIVGSFIILWAIGGSINMVSMFAFIITLGIIVDDAVIVGENIFYHRQRATSGVKAAITGAREMAAPVFVAVLTNILAFTPLLFVPGSTGKFFSILPAVVISVFIISFIECLYILPTHLSYSLKKNGGASAIAGIPRFFNNRLHGFVNGVYGPLLSRTLANRYLVLIIATAMLATGFFYWRFGWINFSFRPSILTDSVDAEIELPYGVAPDEVNRIALLVEEAGLAVVERNGGENILEGVRREIGRRGSNHAEVTFTLVSQNERDISTRDFSRQWRAEVGAVPGLERLFFDYMVGPGGSSAINVQLSHPDPVVLETAAAELAAFLGQYQGVTDIDDGFARGKPQLDFQLSPEGISQGLTARELGAQLRHALYGAEALRQQRGDDEVKVMVRLPEDERSSLAILEQLLIRVPDDTLIPLAQAATFTTNRAYTEIKRVDGRRVLNATANIIPGQANENKILADLRATFLPELLARHGGLRYSFEGRERQRQEAIKQLGTGMLLLFPVVFAILSILFRSYLQAVIVMSTTPFGLLGAMLGHIIMGYDLSIISIFGMIALCGIVINGGLVLVATANSYRDGGLTPLDAAKDAAMRRLRPILLTAVTTFLGLAPMIFEQSIQARFLVPMAISLGYGIVFSTLIILVIVPCLYVVADDIGGLFRKIQRTEPLLSENSPSGTAISAAKTSDRNYRHTSDDCSENR